MRWDELFGDLEAQLAEAERAEFDAEVSDRTRREAAALRLVDRLRPLAGARLILLLVTGGSGAADGYVTGELVDLGPDWVLVAERLDRQMLVPLHAVVAVRGATRRSGPPDAQPVVSSRLGLGFALRALAKDRAPVRVMLADGSTRTGTFDRVGADFVELAVHAADEPRRAGAVRDVLVVPFAALVLVRAG